MSTSRYSLNSFGESSSASMVSLSSEDCGDRNIFSPAPSSPNYHSAGTNIMNLDQGSRFPMSPCSPSVSPLPPRQNYALASHITMTDCIDNKKLPMDKDGSRNRTLSESNYNLNRHKQRESISSVASSTDSAKSRVSSRNARNLRRAKSCKNNSRDGSSLSLNSGSTSSLNKKPLADCKVSK